MISLPGPVLRRIVDAAERAFPEECCGLLVGRAHGPMELLITRIETSRNVIAGDPRTGFEVDPQVRFDLMRVLGDGPERLVGLYHSHPGHGAQPSRRDLELAWEPDLAWLITSVIDGQAVLTTAHVLDSGGRQFRQVLLRTDDWVPYPARDDQGQAP